MFVSPCFVDTSAKSPPKPCLKRRSSVPPTTTTTGIRRQEGSCESLSSSYGSMASEDSSVIGSRKSVVFADSVGEDLCRIKVFSKELHEHVFGKMQGFDESWPGAWSSEGGLWFVGDDEGCEDVIEEDWYADMDEDEEDIEGYDEVTGGHSVVHEVLEEEDETDLAEYEEKKPEPVIRPEANTVITPTFISPMDLPEYAEQLERLGLSLEAVDVHGATVTGSVRAHPRLASGFQSRSVHARLSHDSWRTSERVPALPCDGSTELYEFKFDVGGMSVGDDVELVVETDLVKDGEKGRIVDDNSGLKYRIICKSRTKFRPGKSLW